MERVVRRGGRDWSANEAVRLVYEANRFGWEIRRCLLAGSYFACSGGRRARRLVLKVVQFDSRFSAMMMSDLIMADKLGAVSTGWWEKDPSAIRVETILGRRPEQSLLVPLGSLRITPFALIRVRPGDVLWALDRHRQCDAGDLAKQRSNVSALLGGLGVQSLYRIGDDDVLYVVTEADRSATTVLMGEDSWTLFRA